MVPSGSRRVSTLTSRKRACTGLTSSFVAKVWILTGVPDRFLGQVSPTLASGECPRTVANGHPGLLAPLRPGMTGYQPALDIAPARWSLYGSATSYPGNA